MASSVPDQAVSSSSLILNTNPMALQAIGCDVGVFCFANRSVIAILNESKRVAGVQLCSWVITCLRK